MGTSPWLSLLISSASLSAFLWAVALRRRERPLVIASLVLALVAVGASSASVADAPRRATPPAPRAAAAPLTVAVALPSRAAVSRDR